MFARENNRKVVNIFNRKAFSMGKVVDIDESSYDMIPSINNNERRPFDRSSSSRQFDERYERTDNGVVTVERSSLRKSDFSPSSVTPLLLFNIALSNGTFQESLVTKNGFAIGNYYRYWQDLFDLRPCPSIYAITVTYEILGKEEAKNFLLKHFEEKFIWLHDSFPLGFMYNKSHGPLSPPSTIEMMFALGEISWINGNGEHLLRYTRNASIYMKDLNLCSTYDLNNLPPLDMDVLINTISDIIY
ncbi:hypothetical protein BCR36DRAFT_578950 [Piromyces finnis]|uniref:Uncharacterized protein n=1 Tax=Piromyces finnis TaxID=1754191 RepID=A0A1Y1VN79_9FUNG|nr:hypothetical protein BCR36DRAFT_578950 [Piromyces finnis]|eukprot:ORX60877.1 hypothetical protein BCR36DRAFT_578950 [Piromyces finnis]